MIYYVMPSKNGGFFIAQKLEVSYVVADLSFCQNCSAVVSAGSAPTTVNSEGNSFRLFQVYAETAPAEVTPGDVNTVFFTRLHPDHVG